MATTQLLPIYAKLSRKVLRRRASAGSAGSLEILTGMDRFLLALTCPAHAWNWPRANRSERLAGYDAHQTCHKCMSHRMFDTQTWQAGPIYKKHDHSN